MAKIKQASGFGAMTGRLGGVVFANTVRGTVMRSVPTQWGSRTSAQSEIAQNLRMVNAAWRNLSDAEFQAWQTYAVGQTAPDPATGLPVTPKAVNLYVALGTRFLMVQPSAAIPTTPPEGIFLGDLVQVTLAGDPGTLLVTASQPNAPGTVTEILTQRLAGPHNAPKSKSYTRRVIIAFSAPDQTEPIELPPATHAVAVRFIEAATGRATSVIPVGRMNVPGL